MAQRIKEFEQWQPGYSGSIVTVYKAGTSTKASIYNDEALTSSVSNPQALLSYSENGVSYGRFAQPIYTADAYELDIDNGNRTGVQRVPLTTLAGQDASQAVVTPKGASVASDLATMAARTIHAADYGELGTVTATNTATLTAAIGAAAQNNGGYVILPDGNFQFSTLTIPSGVVLMGQGEDATTLRSQTADKVVTLSGTGAGLAHLTLDGVDLQAGATGVYAKAIEGTVLSHCKIKRFVTGVHLQGGRRTRWLHLNVSSCDVGVKLHGDNDASNGEDGDEFRNNSWEGGKVEYCTTTGLELSYVDKKCWFNKITNVGFKDSAGTALKVNGARWTNLSDCWWVGNTKNIEVQDDDDTDNAEENTVIGLDISHASINGGEIDLTGKCQDIVFDDCGLFGVTLNLTLPENSILLRDCVEDADVVVTGDGTKLTRWRGINHGASAGLTSDGVATKAWSKEMEPGQVGYFEGKVLANQKDGLNTAEYHIAVSARRPGSKLSYDTQVGDFTVGELLTGAVSGAQALIVADTDNGADGTLTLRNIVGEFQNNEQITDPQGGDALANGTLVTQSVALLGAVESLRPAREDATGLAATFVANGAEVELQVTGQTDKTYEWLCDVSAVVS